MAAQRAQSKMAEAGHCLAELRREGMRSVPQDLDCGKRLINEKHWKRIVAGYLRTRVRDMVPVRYQVPAKFWYGWARGKLEPEMKILASLVQRGETVVDVGGNRGIYAYSLWRLGCKVEVFEPNPACCAVLQAWCEERPNVNLHPVALSSRRGEASLHIPVDAQGVEHDASASLEHADFERARDQVVAITTLDSFGYRDATLIKIDVEGHEQSVLEGCAETLATAKPALLIEIEQRHNKRPIAEIFGSVESQGYRGFYLNSGRLRALESFNVEADQSQSAFDTGAARYINNFVFLHEEKIGSGRYKTLMASAT